MAGKVQLLTASTSPPALRGGGELELQKRTSFLKRKPSLRIRWEYAVRLEPTFDTLPAASIIWGK